MRRALVASLLSRIVEKRTEWALRLVPPKSEGYLTKLMAARHPKKPRLPDGEIFRKVGTYAGMKLAATPKAQTRAEFDERPLDVIYYGIYQWSSEMHHTAKIFRNGRSQAVRLPAGYRFEGPEVYIRRDEVTGDVILSRKPPSWDDFFALVNTLDIPADFMEDRQQEPPQERDIF